MNIRVQTIEEAAYERALKACQQAGKASVSIIQKDTRSTYNGALAHLQRMQQEGIIGAPDDQGEHPLLTQGPAA